MSLGGPISRESDFLYQIVTFSLFDPLTIGVKHGRVISLMMPLPALVTDWSQRRRSQ